MSDAGPRRTVSTVIAAGWHGLQRRPRLLITVNWVFQFLLVFAVIFFQGLNTAHGLVTMELTPERMAKIFGFADAGSYLQAAENLIANSKITPEWQWVYNLWPPGMVWVDAATIRFSPLPYGITIGLVTCLVWSVALALLTWPFVRRAGFLRFVLAAELIVLATSPFQSWMFDEGLFYADGLAAGTFLIGVALIINRTRSGGPLIDWIRDGIFASLAFAAAIYLRASYQLVPWALGAIAVLIAVIALVKRLRKRPIAGLWHQAVLVGVAAAGVLVLVVPYSYFVHQTAGRYQFVQTEDLVYQHAWEDGTRDKVPQWMLDGGSTIGCDLDSRECDIVHEDIAEGKTPSPTQLKDKLVAAIAGHPLQFIGNRVSFVYNQWFADEIASYSHVKTNYQSGAVSYSASDNLNPPQGFLYLGLFLLSLVASFVLVARGRWALLIVPVSAIVLLAPFAIVHVEVRYLIPLKMLGLAAPVLLLMLWETQRGRRTAIGVGDASHVTERTSELEQADATDSAGAGTV